MGSSCFCRGNRNMAAELQAILEEKGWQDAAEIRGGLCKDNCSNGPHIQINNKPVSRCTPALIINMIEEEIQGSPDISSAKG